MKCPACKNEMLVMEFEGIELDICSSCSGTWFDEGEIELLAEKINSVTGDLEVRKDVSEKKRKCPVCSKKMEKVSEKDKKLPVLDRCTHLHGLFFDRGEITDFLGKKSDNKALAFLFQSFSIDKKKENPDE